MTDWLISRGIRNNTVHFVLIYTSFRFELVIREVLYNFLLTNRMKFPSGRMTTLAWSYLGEKKTHWSMKIIIYSRQLSFHENWHSWYGKLLKVCLDSYCISVYWCEFSFLNSFFLFFRRVLLACLIDWLIIYCVFFISIWWFALHDRYIASPFFFFFLP